MLHKNVNFIRKNFTPTGVDFTYVKFCWVKLRLRIIKIIQATISWCKATSYHTSHLY